MNEEDKILTNRKTNHETLTGGIFYCRDSTEVKDWSSLEILYRFDSEVLRNRQQNIPPNRYLQPRSQGNIMTRTVIYQNF